MGKINISPSSIKLMQDCERCFYMDRVLKDGKRPRGISSTLPNALDKMLKEYYDNHRAN